MISSSTHLFFPSTEMSRISTPQKPHTMTSGSVPAQPGSQGISTISTEEVQPQHSRSGEIGNLELPSIDVPSTSMEMNIPAASTSSLSSTDDCHVLDIGKWVGKSSSLGRSQKMNILKECWVPPEDYDFREDVAGSNRKFIHNWLKIYEPWLSYSKELKGALCLFCVLFPPSVVQGVLGAFIVTPFTKYKDMHDSCKNHMKSQWHKRSTESAKRFMDDVPVDVQAISGHQLLIEQNRKILSSIISTILFCGTHDLPLRGKQSHAGKLYIIL